MAEQGKVRRLGALPRRPSAPKVLRILTKTFQRVQEKKRGPEWNVHISQGPNRLRRETAFMCNIRFRNDLPEVPAAGCWSRGWRGGLLGAMCAAGDTKLCLPRWPLACRCRRRCHGRCCLPRPVAA